jgi:hypothetical protein
MVKEPILQVGTDKMTLRYAVHKPFMFRLPDRNEWDRGTTHSKEGLIWYTDGSRANKGTGTSVYGHSVMQKFIFSIGWYTVVFQAKLFAIEAFTFSQTVKLQLKHLTIARFIQGYSGPAINF